MEHAQQQQVCNLLDRLHAQAVKNHALVRLVWKKCAVSRGDACLSTNTTAFNVKLYLNNGNSENNVSPLFTCLAIILLYFAYTKAVD